MYTDLSKIVTNNSHGFSEIQIDKSQIKISGSEEAATLMDVMYTDIGLEFNFNRVYQEAYQRCRADLWCDFNLGGLSSLLNQLSSQILEERGS